MSETHMVKLGDVCDIIIGRTPARKDPSFWGGELPWLSIADMNQGRNITQTKEKITNAGAGKGKIILPGTVLLSFKLSIGKVGINTIPLYTNEAIAALPIKKPSLIYPEYLACFLESQNFDSLGNRAAMGKTLNKKSLQELEIPLPSLEEQKRIVNILDKARSIQEARQKQLAALDELASSIFKETVNNSETSLVKLGDICKFTHGGTPKKSVSEYWEGDIPWISSADISSSGEITFRFFISEDAVNNSSTNVAPANTVLLVNRTGVGKTAITSVPTAISQDITVINHNDSLVNTYLLYFLRSKKQYFINNSRGATIQGFPRRIAEELRIPLPSLKVQHKFSARIQKINIRKRKLNISLDKSYALSNSFQATLLSARS